MQLARLNDDDDDDDDEILMKMMMMTLLKSFSIATFTTGANLFFLGIYQAAWGLSLE